jgi:acetoin:2,6-dichlorophenolindophenol oxidoreductase subunit alpha
MTSKALITESDVRRAIQDGSLTIHVSGQPIITPLAASSISEQGIKVIQDDFCQTDGSPVITVDKSCPDAELNLQGRDTAFLLRLYSMMWRVRMFEEAMGILFREKYLLGFLHLSIGQEAVSTGTCAALKTNDYLTLTHRGHGQMVARGSDLKKMAAELLGKSTGYCKGKGGSVHLADFQNGILGANGIIGASLVIATGAAMSAKIRKTDQVAVAFFGDGATNQGAFHEALNYAAIQKLPILFVCENNQYAVSTSCSEASACSSFANRGAAYGMEGIQIDGMNVLEVYDNVRDAVNRARKGGGPTFIECLTYRTRGHWEGETTDLRPSEEKELWKKRDAIERLKRALIASNLVSGQQLQDIYNIVADEVAEAVRFAVESPYPDLKEALTNVTASG